MAAVPTAALAPLTRRYQAALAAMSARTIPFVARAWDDLDSYDEADVDGFAAAIAPYMQAAKSGAVAQSAGYLNAVFGTVVAVNAARVASAYDPADPFFMVWRALQRGVPWEDAVAAGRRQLDATVAHFTMSSARRTGDEYARAGGHRVEKWRRVTDGGACEWCQQAAADDYHSAESADFGHLRCGCTAVPVIGGFDPSEHVA